MQIGIVMNSFDEFQNLIDQGNALLQQVNGM